MDGLGTTDSLTGKDKVISMGVKRKVMMKQGKSQIMLSDSFSEFLAEKVTLNLSEKTIFNYRQSYSFFVEHEFDEQDIACEDMLKIYVQQWVGDMLREKKKVSTINHYLRDLRSFLYWCMHEDRQYIKPFSIDLVKGQEEMMKVFTDDEVIALTQKPTRSNSFTEWRNWCITNWVLATGNRAATICNVKIGDIDFKGKQIVLRHTKNKKAQCLPLSSTLETVLKKYINKCRSGKDITNDSWLFPSIEEEQLTYNALAHSFRKYCLDREVEHTNIHGLRHYFATFWAKKNKGDGDRLQMILGHSDYTMTKRYIKLVDEDLRENYDEYTPLDNMNKAKRHRKKVQMK
jgi:integrase/recombinase XerD